MSETELRDKLRSMVSNVIEVDDFSDDENFVRDLGLDSMMGLEIVARIEKSFHIRMPEEYLPRLQSLNDIVSSVHEVLAAA